MFLLLGTSDCEELRSAENLLQQMDISYKFVEYDQSINANKEFLLSLINTFYPNFNESTLSMPQVFFVDASSSECDEIVRKLSQLKNPNLNVNNTIYIGGLSNLKEICVDIVNSFDGIDEEDQNDEHEV